MLELFKGDNLIDIVSKKRRDLEFFTLRQIETQSKLDPQESPMLRQLNDRGGLVSPNFEPDSN